MTTAERKNEHLRIAAEEAVELLPESGSIFSEISLVHSALPELDLDEVDTSTSFLGKKLSMPLMIGCMTGGTDEAEEINRTLAAAAEATGVAMGLGSQRVMVEQPQTATSFQIRDVAPTTLLIANFGAVQLNKGMSIDDIAKATTRVGADALVFHLNAAQEAVQPEGDTNFNTLVTLLADAMEKIDVPCGLKEVGAGFSIQDAQKISALPLSFLESAGKGGTSWTAIEAFRCENDYDRRLGELFANWGIPSPMSLQSCIRYGGGVPVIASGGIRSGLDAAKCIAMGADMSAMALPFLKAARISTEAVLAEIKHFERALKTAMFLTSSRSIADLKKARINIPKHLTPEAYEGQGEHSEESTS